MLFLQAAHDDIDIHGDPVAIWRPWVSGPLLLRRHRLRPSPGRGAARSGRRCASELPRRRLNHDRRGERDPMVLRPGRPQRCPRALQDLVGPLGQHAGRLTYHGLRVVEVDLPATGVCELGEHLAVHDRVGPGLVRRATLDGDVVGEVRAARLGARSRRPARAARLRARRARLTSPERRTLAPSRPARPWRRRRDAGSRSGSAPATCRVRSARSAGGPRPRGPPTP